MSTKRFLPVTQNSQTFTSHLSFIQMFLQFDTLNQFDHKTFFNILYSSWAREDITTPKLCFTWNCHKILFSFLSILYYTSLSTYTLKNVCFPLEVNMKVIFFISFIKVLKFTYLQLNICNKFIRNYIQIIRKKI